MRRRFLLSIAAADLSALALAVVLASLIVLDRFLPWTRPRLPVGESIWPLLGLVLVGAVFGSYASARAWAGAAPRPTYGRALTIVLTALAVASLGLVLSRTYFLAAIPRRHHGYLAGGRFSPSVRSTPTAVDRAAGVDHQRKGIGRASPRCSSC